MLPGLDSALAFQTVLLIEIGWESSSVKRSLTQVTTNAEDGAQEQAGGSSFNFSCPGSTILAQGLGFGPESRSDGGEAIEARFPHFADSLRRHLRDGVVDAGGDVEQVEDLVLEVGQFGVEGAQHRAVGSGEFVAGDAGEDLEDPCGGGWAAPRNPDTDTGRFYAASSA